MRQHTVLATVALLAPMLVGCEPPPSREQQERMIADARLEAAAAQFRTERPALKEKVDKLLAEGRPEEAVNLLQPYLGRLDDEMLELRRKAKQMITDRRMGELIADAKRRKPTDHQALLLIYAELEKLDSRKDEWRKLWGQHRAALDRIEEAQRQRAQAADRAARRKQGVTVGMTKEEVLMSNWGKPRRVNATTTRHGRREQWVYNGGYLYFDETGRLTAIQN